MMRIRFNPAMVRCILACGVLALTVATATAQQIRPRIVETIDNSQRVTLRGGTPPLVTMSQDRGAMPDATPANRMLLVLQRSSAQQLSLEQSLVDLHNPASPQYHHWLTPGDFAAKFGPSDSDIATVSAWLTSQGFSVAKVTRGKAAIEFSGTAGQVRQSFHTELHTYTHDGVTFHANNTDPQIPAALAPVVAGIAALNDLKPQQFAHVIGKASFDPRTHAATPSNTGDWSYPVSGGGVYLATAPGDLAVQYNINPIYQAGATGAGETIGIVSQAGVDNSIVANYRKLFGLPGNLPTEIVDGFDPGSNGDGAGIEAQLDVEVTGSTAPGANIYLYTGYDTNVTVGFFTAAIRAVDDNAADVISVSYGICEPTLGLAGNLLFSQLWAQASAQGQSVFVSSGDSGSAGCDNGRGQAESGLAVNGITSTPYNVSVGGTDFYYSNYAASQTTLQTQINSYWNTKGSASPTASILKVVPEQPWNDAFGLNVGGAVSNGTTASGSGGPSNCVTGTAGAPNGPLDSYVSCGSGYAKPAWQNAPGVPKDGARDIPDIALFAANGANFSFYPICSTATDCTTANADPTTGAVQITGIGGTSASTPLMAGIMALIDQSLKGRQGNPNYVLYALAKSTPSVFHDVTVGNNNVPCVQGSKNCTLDTNGDGFYTLQGYNTGAGYDLASGLGSIDANALLTNWTKVSFTPTVTTLALSSTTFAHGTPVTVTSVVGASGGSSASMPTGAVSLIATSVASPQTSFGTLTLTNGTAQASLNSLPAGTYTLTAQYGGDGTFAASISDPISLTVTPENSSIAITGNYFGVTSTGDTAPPAPVTNNMTALYGSFFDIDIKVFGASSTAAVPDGLPSGTITVFDNGKQLTTLTIPATGVAEFQTGSLAAGSHALTFAYSGDGSFNATTSSPFNITVTKGIPQILLSYAIPAGLPAGGTLQIPVSVTTSAGQLPLGGTITVNFGSQSQQVAVLQQSNAYGLSSIGYGTATVDISTPGTYALNASYSGDSNLQPIATAFNPTTVVIYKGTLQPTKTVVTMSGTSIGPNGSLTATIHVTGGATTPTGHIDFFQNGLYQTIFQPLDATGTVVIPVPASSIIGNGNVQFLAVYGGDNYNSPSLSAPVTVASNVGEYSLNTSTTSIAMKAGAAGTAMITVGAPYGQRFTGNVALSCATSSPNITCAFSSSSLTLPTDPTLVAASTLTISSVATVNASAKPASRIPGILGGSGITLALLWICLPVRRSRRIRPLMLALAGLLTMSMGLTGCSNVTPPPPTVTAVKSTAGTYSATVTAVASGVTKTLVMKVTLQ